MIFLLFMKQFVKISDLNSKILWVKVYISLLNYSTVLIIEKHSLSVY